MSELPATVSSHQVPQMLRQLRRQGIHTRALERRYGLADSAHTEEVVKLAASHFDPTPAGWSFTTGWRASRTDSGGTYRALVIEVRRGLAEQYLASVDRSRAHGAAQLSPTQVNAAWRPSAQGRS